MEPEEKYTTISIKASTKIRLEEIKIHPNQSFDEIVNRMMDKLNL